ncbi:hypothetical protein [Nocardioides donggukensis]|uniref:Uncharacterized protein n=1 Tax=Nocardioides donggukensis TaxID=2774019 RepID=A0A927PZI1_9ACTN|nr:hypothetical protein [Nocardioides donggukensis]MBD8870238.1 hypothetical protein [Nocardioides donggukensis]
MLTALLSAVAGAASAAPPDRNKVYVCKYSSQGDSERLQTFNQVAVSTIEGFPSDPADAVFPYLFGDSQGRSIAIGFVDNPARTRDDCPAPRGGTEVSVPATPSPSAATCDTDGALVVPVTEHVLTRVNGVLVEQSRTFGPGTYTISYEAAEGYVLVGQQPGPVAVDAATDDCPVEPVPVDVPATPSPSAATCDTDGALVVPVTEHVLTRVNGVLVEQSRTFGPGTYTISYEAAEGYVLVGQQPGPVAVDAATDDCPVEPVPVDVPATPSPSAATCDTDGVLVVPVTEHVVTRVDGTLVEQESTYGPGTYTVSYEAAEGYVLVGQQPGPVTVDAATDDCAVEPVPVDVPATPSPSAATCDTDGVLVVPVTEHVVTRVDGTLVEQESTYGPGTYTVSYEAAEGYVLVGQQPGPVTVDAATDDCAVEPVEVAMPTTPSPSAATCDTDGALVVPVTENVLTRVDGTLVEQESTFGPGTYTVSYEAAEGFVLVGQQPGPVTVDAATDDCQVVTEEPGTVDPPAGPGTDSPEVAAPVAPAAPAAPTGGDTPEAGAVAPVVAVPTSVDAGVDSLLPVMPDASASGSLPTAPLGLAAGLLLLGLGLVLRRRADQL